MAKTDSQANRDARSGLAIVLTMLAMVVIPAAITLRTIKSPGILLISDSNPTPYGYTWSLLLFAVPISVIAFWFLRDEKVQIPRRSFWITIALIAPMGCALDFFFAWSFLTFKGAGATLGIKGPALGPDWTLISVPIEEYAFYVSGFLAVLLIYVWLDEYWLSEYNVPDYAGKAQKISRLVKFHPSSLIVGVVLIIIAVIYKKFFSSYREGFPGYFTVLVLGGLIPSVGLFESAKRFINWRALSLTMFFILLVSLFWEVTLAVPYGWWGYQKPQMLGFFIRGWADLPIEAVCVWIAVTYGTIIIYETVKLWQASRRSVLHSFLGIKN